MTANWNYNLLSTHRLNISCPLHWIPYPVVTSLFVQLSTGELVAHTRVSSRAGYMCIYVCVYLNVQIKTVIYIFRYHGVRTAQPDFQATCN